MIPDRIVLTLPPDPAFSRLTRLVTQHFLRLHGIHLSEARRRGASVETRVRTALRAARSQARGGARRNGRMVAASRRHPGEASGTLALTLVARRRELEVMLRRMRGGTHRLLVVDRPAAAP